VDISDVSQVIYNQTKAIGNKNKEELVAKGCEKLSRAVIRAFLFCGMSVCNVRCCWQLAAIFSGFEWLK